MRITEFACTMLVRWINCSTVLVGGSKWLMYVCTLKPLVSAFNGWTACAGTAYLLNTFALPLSCDGAPYVALLPALSLQLQLYFEDEANAAPPGR